MIIASKWKALVLFESPITLNDTWGFKYFDDNWKDTGQVLRIKNI